MVNKVFVGKANGESADQKLYLSFLLKPSDEIQRDAPNCSEKERLDGKE